MIILVLLFAAKEKKGEILGTPGEDQNPKYSIREIDRFYERIKTDEVQFPRIPLQKLTNKRAMNVMLKGALRTLSENISDPCRFSDMAACLVSLIRLLYKRAIRAELVKLLKCTSTFKKACVLEGRYGQMLKKTYLRRRGVQIVQRFWPWILWPPQA